MHDSDLILIVDSLNLYSLILILIFTLFFDPSVAFAVIVTVLPAPAFFAVTTPFFETVAYFLLLDVHFNFLFAAGLFAVTTD